jgi:TonB family protein
MSKALTRLTLALLVAMLCAHAAAAQETPAVQTPAPSPEWVAVSPSSEEFAALMPKAPLGLEQDVRVEELAATGRRYTATAPGGARYVVWSLRDTQKVGERLKANGRGQSFPGELRYLDLVAEAGWELLVKPEFERLEVEKARTGRVKEFVPRMTLQRMFDLGGRAAREYALRLEKEGGPVYVCADGERLYVVAALAPDPQAADSRRFVESFAVGTKTPNPPAPAKTNADIIPLPTKPDTSGVLFTSKPNTGGGDVPVDYDRPFKQSEVSQKARITFKPEPGFTEWARRFEVTGVVRLRAILSKTGEVTNVSVVKHLPHGLTEMSIDAARRIRFEPAQKDGQPVSQYVVLEYNYNIY